jgi:hypothetical protein
MIVVLSLKTTIERSHQMAKQRGAPRLQVQIAQAQWDKAVRSNSGGCLIADAIASQYPHLSAVTVDMATIRASDRAKGERYTWLTPGPAQHLLLSFDQGWTQAAESFQLRNPVRITKSHTSAPRIVSRATRLQELEAKEQDQTLTRPEQSALSRMRNTNAMRPTPLPTSQGPVTSVTKSTVIGGSSLPKPTAAKHPNLLTGRDRHFGAKLASPGLAFDEAVAAAVADRLMSSTAEARGGVTQTPAPTDAEA